MSGIRKLIAFSEIEKMNLEEVLNYLDGIEKCKLRDFKVVDLLNMENLQKPLMTSYFRDLSDSGVYLFYDEHNKIRYVGQSKKGFYERVMVQLDTTFYPGFGWNAFLRKLGGIRTGKNHNELTEEDHEEDLKILYDYHLLMIAVPADFDETKLRWLEKYIMKAYLIRDRANGESLLLNTNVGGLYDSDWEKTLGELLEG